MVFWLQFLLQVLLQKFELIFVDLFEMQVEGPHEFAIHNTENDCGIGEYLWYIFQFLLIHIDAVHYKLVYLFDKAVVL